MSLGTYKNTWAVEYKNIWLICYLYLLYIFIHIYWGKKYDNVLIFEMIKLKVKLIISLLGK